MYIWQRESMCAGYVHYNSTECPVWVSKSQAGYKLTYVVYTYSMPFMTTIKNWFWFVNKKREKKEIASGALTLLYDFYHAIKFLLFYCWYSLLFIWHLFLFITYFYCTYYFYLLLFLFTIIFDWLLFLFTILIFIVDIYFCFSSWKRKFYL